MAVPKTAVLPITPRGKVGGDTQYNTKRVSPQKATRSQDHYLPRLHRSDPQTPHAAHGTAFHEPQSTTRGGNSREQTRRHTQKPLHSHSEKTPRRSNPERPTAQHTRQNQ